MIIKKYGINMDLTKQYNEKELTITVRDIDAANAPDIENEIWMK